VYPEANFGRWKQQKQELTAIVCENCCLYRFREHGIQFHATSLLNERLKVQMGVVCTNNMEEQVFFTAKDFTLHEVTITVQGNDSEMPAYFDVPCSYTINDVDVEC
jgi:hypothetical protein